MKSWRSPCWGVSLVSSLEQLPILASQLHIVPSSLLSLSFFLSFKALPRGYSFSTLTLDQVVPYIFKLP